MCLKSPSNNVGDSKAIVVCFEVGSKSIFQGNSREWTASIVLVVSFIFTLHFYCANGASEGTCQNESSRRGVA